jgi:hypothetical protein
LVQDARMRVRVSAERRAALLAEFDKSGMSAARFAAWSGVKYPTFAAWLQRRRRDRPSNGGAPGELEGVEKVRWLEALITDKAAGGALGGGGRLLVHLPGGARLEIGDGSSVHLAAELLKALSREGGRC